MNEIVEWLQNHDAADDDKPSYAVHSSNMDTVIKCRNCEKETRYGNSYRSRHWKLRTSVGEFFYLVCKECKEKELGRKLR